jgi:hypothetical protein
MKKQEKQLLKKESSDTTYGFININDGFDLEAMTEDDAADEVAYGWDVKGWLRERGVGDYSEEERTLEWM